MMNIVVMSHPTFIFKQNQRKQTPITTIPHLQNRTNTTTYLFNCTEINIHLKVMDLWTAPVEVGSLLAEGGNHSASGPGC